MVSTKQDAIKTRKPRTNTDSVTKAEAWVFATPDFSEFDKWDKIGVRDLQAGDYLAYRAPQGNESRAVLRILASTVIAGGVGMVTVETVWTNTKSGRSGGPRGIQWKSLGNKNYYRMFYPTVPAPEPDTEEPTQSEEPAVSDGLVWADTTTAETLSLLRDNNKIMCSMLAGISALHDEIRELKELCAEAWGAK
jgi:hypothetical protein